MIKEEKMELGDVFFGNEITSRKETCGKNRHQEKKLVQFFEAAMYQANHCLDESTTYEECAKRNSIM